MTKTDGTESHKHFLTDFKLLDLVMKNKTLTENGVIILGGLANLRQDVHGMGNLTIKDIPVKVEIFNMRILALTLDKNKINNHFGNTAIFGEVVPRKTS